MASILGPREAVDLVFAVGGMDAARILNFQNRNGLSSEDIIRRAAAAVGGANESVMARWGGVTYITNDLFARYRAGVGGTARKTPKKVEGATTDAVKGTLSGHMLPIENLTDKLAWSWEWLRDAYEAQIDADCQEVADSFRYVCEVQFLNRIFSKTENLIGSGYDVPWAIGTGTNVNFIPPPWQDNQFSSSHTHFIAIAGSTAADLKSNRNNMIKELRHHGVEGTLAQFVSEADIDSWAAVEGFVEVNPANVQIVTGGSSAVRFVTGQLEGVPGELFGFFKTNRGVVELRYLPLIPTGFSWMTKSYGVNAVENGLAVRVHPSTPFGLIPDVMLTKSVTPKLEAIDLKATHGIGINRRINGVVSQFGNGTYTWTAL